MRRLLALTALTVLTGATFADPEKVVQAELTKLKGEGARVQVIKDDAVSKTFPQVEFVSVIFPQFPVARLAPEPLKSANLYAVTKDDKATLISEPDALKKLFLAGKFDESEAGRKRAAISWLRLLQELYQDGFYRFKVDEDSFKTADGRVTGKVVVAEGGNGEISVAMTIKDGVLAEIASGVNLKAGIRPRCHATLLLDANPLVRRIVEEDLLVMGRPALPYLEEQHRKASLELKIAIERVRNRILTGER